MAADFTAPFALPAAIRDMPKVGFFPGSTIGNFEPHEACAFLRSAREILGKGALMVIGVDLEKDERCCTPPITMPPASPRDSISMCWCASTANSAAISTSRAFMHRAIYNRDRHRIEMHLISRKAQTVRLLGRSFAFRAGESIHTESSYKYSLAAVYGAGPRLGLGSW